MKEKSKANILWYKDTDYKDVPLVGGKNASLGELIKVFQPKGINIPDGFSLTANAYWLIVKANGLEEKLKKIFTGYNPKSIKSLQKTGKSCRQLFLNVKIPQELEVEIIEAYKGLEKKYGRGLKVAVRSSGVAEDAPTASFAGQFETFLNVSGGKELLKNIKKCLASSFGDRAISYRQEKNVSQVKFALSIGIQKMVRSETSSAGIIFTLDTESGFRDVVLINSIYGVGEMIVKGKITPDEFYVFKPTLAKGYEAIIRKNLGRKKIKYIYGVESGLKEVSVNKKDQIRFSLNDKEILCLAKWAVEIEKHYNRPQDIEWAKDGDTGDLFIVQSRPETIHAVQKTEVLEEYKIKTKKKPILTGIAVGDKIGQGKVRIIFDVARLSEFKKGEVLVTKMTDPDWVSAFPMASAIVTAEGGSTCHAAIISRELGVPCIVGAEDATKVLTNGQEVTVDCAQGRAGRIFSGKVSFELKKTNLEKLPKLKTKIMVNIGAPEIAFKTSFLPVEGVGLAREEFIIAEKIRVHPLALYHYEKLKAQSLKDEKIAKIIGKIDDLTIEHQDKREYFIKELAEGIGQIAAAFYPDEVIVRFSDFKTNEYRNLIGGELFEGEESNPMLGFRGALRYLDKEFQLAFGMECEAIKRVRNIFGLKNVSLMIPFCRTIKEGTEVLKKMKMFGLGKGKGLKIYVMCEIPSNVVLAKEFLEIFDGMSIGSNDLTQLSLGLDRDNSKLASSFDERDKTIKEMIKKVIVLCRQEKKYCGICGDAPSSFPDFAEFLLKNKIPSISLSPDVIIKMILKLGGK